MKIFYQFDDSEEEAIHADEYPTTDVEDVVEEYEEYEDNIAEYNLNKKRKLYKITVEEQTIEQFKKENGIE